MFQTWFEFVQKGCVMELVEAAWHFFSAFLVFLSGLVIVLAERKYFGLSSKRVLLLYGWHTLWCMIYLRRSLINMPDATFYYENALLDYSVRMVGTGFIISFVRVLVQYGGLSYLGCFLVFNILGSIGLIAFDGALRTVVKWKAKKWQKVAALIVFLPSVSYWSSAIGKDAISFMATCLALWAALALSRRYKLMIFAVTMMFLVRPHMAGLMVLGVFLSVVLGGRFSVLKRTFLTLLLIAVAVVLIPFAINYAGVVDYSVDGAMEYVEQREGHNMDGGGAVDISSMTPPLRMVTYLFRPFPFEAKSILQFAASIENFILLVLFVAGIFRILMRRAKNKSIEGKYFLAIYSMMALLVLGMMTANLGIAVRQKWMFMPMLMILLLSTAVTDARKPARLISPLCGRKDDLNDF